MRIVLAGLLVASLLAGCLTGPGTPAGPAGGPPGTWGFSRAPSFPNAQPAVVTHLEPLARLMGADGEPFPTGSGNVVFGDYVFGSAQSHGFFIADIHDPAHPVLVYNSSSDGPTPFARKADLIEHPDGRRTLVLATQSNGMHFWNVTDVRHPEFASVVEFDKNHNIAVVPGTELVFNNPSSGQGGTNGLVDASDPYDPRLLGDFGAYGCHGTTFHGRFGDPDFRAYCAAIQRTEIWDLTALTTAPRVHGFGIRLLGAVEGAADSPITGSPVANPPIPPNAAGVTSTPLRNLHHFATASNDGRVLIVGDEHRGGGSPGACYAYNEAAGASTPMGALWFYDIANPADPVLLSWISPPTVTPVAPTPPSNPNPGPTVVAQGLNAAYTAVPNCTAHFGTVLPGEDKIVIAWYSAGVLLIDFSDAAKPRILDQYQAPGINTWNARQWGGYVFTGDIGRGMDVLKLA
ncbi:MAG TPA: hypothetical protein VM286_06310 [Candidatus Thermoplasmatota archaeon]|nr:hypothetical protein [Candidatus Thermoplasmatota archaeon]